MYTRTYWPCLLPHQQVARHPHDAHLCHTANEATHAMHGSHYQIKANGNGYCIDSSHRDIEASASCEDRTNVNTADLTTQKFLFSNLWHIWETFVSKTSTIFQNKYIKICITWNVKMMNSADSELNWWNSGKNEYFHWSFDYWFCDLRCLFMVSANISHWTRPNTKRLMINWKSFNWLAH